MSLAQVVFPPPTKTGMEEWAFAHFQHHIAIIEATLAIKNVRLNLYQLYPFNEHATADWLRQHQEAHNEFNAVYGVNGNDLSSVDFKNKKQKDAYFWLNFNEHRNVGKLCGVPI